MDSGYNSTIGMTDQKFANICKDILEIFNEAKKRLQKIKLLTKGTIKRKTVDLQKYDEIQTECLNLCIIWRDLETLIKSIQQHKTLNSKNLEVFEKLTKELSTFSFRSTEFEEDEFQNVNRIHDFVKKVEPDFQKIKNEKP